VPKFPPIQSVIRVVNKAVTTWRFQQARIEDRNDINYWIPYCKLGNISKGDTKGILLFGSKEAKLWA
jgi:hypothetical protein